MKMIAINVKVEDATDKYLKAKAKERVVSKAAVVRDILRDHVEAAKQLKNITEAPHHD